MAIDDAQRTYVDMVAELGARNLPPGGEDMLDDIIRSVPRRAQLILDLGCNTGLVAERLADVFPDASIVGLDISPAMIESARRRVSAPNAMFSVLDVERVGEAFSAVDAAVCAGSSAFFPDRVAALASIGKALAPDGMLVDAHYVYQPSTSASLRELERVSFGIRYSPTSSAQCLLPYETADLPVRSYVSKPPWYLTERHQAATYRSILAALPGMESLVAAMVNRRRLINELARHRHPVLVTAGRSKPTASQPKHSAHAALAVMDLFRAPFQPQPMSRLRSMLPYEFLAYVGDPDAAPGGAAAVSKAATLLGDLGLNPAAAVLDVGCFTGMSTLALARAFPRVVGIDVEPQFISAAQVLGAHLKSPAQFRTMDGGQTGLPGSSQDAYIMTATLGYTPQPGRLLAEAMRVLRPGAFLVEFLYHYPAVNRVIEDRVRGAVGPDVTIGSFSDKVRDVEDAGFRLIRAERIPRYQADPQFLDTMCAAVVASERKRNSLLSDRDLADFEQLFRIYVGRDLGDAEPLVYFCIFSKPDTRGTRDE